MLGTNDEARCTIYQVILIFFLKISVMRLGKKKEKDREQEKEQYVDGVSRLICSPNPKQSHPIPLRGMQNNDFIHKNRRFLFITRQYYFGFFFSLYRWN